MLAETQIPSGNGMLTTTSIEIGISIEVVADFVEVQSAAFSIAMIDDVDVTAKTTEDTLADRLCKFLNRKAGGFPFFFHHENVEDYSSGLSPKVDIGTISRFNQLTIGDKSYGIDDSFFSIEAKRLPSPKAIRKREYVIGEEKPRGGIERFKKGIHGKKLDKAAIIAFIQKEDFDYWLVKINEWISELVVSQSSIWKEDDKLVKMASIYELAKFTSHNFRGISSKEDYIDLLHFWIKVVK
jgi:hypothetical protein